jgi:beta-phosphoglucomutase-like phosphatase (HAD superfamily)
MSGIQCSFQAKTSGSFDDGRVTIVPSGQNLKVNLRPEGRIYVLTDFDGTIVESEPEHQRSFKRALIRVFEKHCETEGLKNPLQSFNLNDLDTAFGLGEHGTASAMIDILNSKIEELRETLGEAVNGFKLDPKIAPQIISYRQEAFDPKRISPINGLDNLMKVIKIADGAAIVTGSASSVVKKILAQESIPEELDYCKAITPRLSADGSIDVYPPKQAKPNPYPYSLGLVRTIAETSDTTDGRNFFDKTSGSIVCYFEDTVTGAKSAIAAAVTSAFSTVPAGVENYTRPQHVIFVSAIQNDTKNVADTLSNILNEHISKITTRTRREADTAALPRIFVCADCGWSQLDINRYGVPAD